MSVTETMVERVARALFAKRNEAAAGLQGIPQYTWEDENQPYREFVMSEARAAIAAMREPTEAMLDKGACYEPDGLARDDGALSEDIWAAMIDASLKD